MAEFFEPSPSSSSNHELDPGFIVMVQKQPFSGEIYKDPYEHLLEFEELCSGLEILGMTQEALRRKLFPFSLIEWAEQWYTRTIGNMSGDWEELRDEFCYSFSLTERIDSLPIDILDFEQLEKESIGAAWARFSRILASIPDTSIPDEVSLEVFYLGLDMETALELDDASGGLFLHTTLEERRDILDSFFDDSFFSTDHNEPRQEESTSSHESLSTPESEPSSSTSQYSSVEPSLEPRTPEEEEIQPSEFSSRFEDVPLGNIQNPSNHLRHEEPMKSMCLYETLDKIFYHTPAMD